MKIQFVLNYIILVYPRIVRYIESQSFYVNLLCAISFFNVQLNRSTTDAFIRVQWVCSGGLCWSLSTGASQPQPATDRRIRKLWRAFAENFFSPDAIRRVDVSRSYFFLFFSQISFFMI